MTPDPSTNEFPQSAGSGEETDERAAMLGFGDGGVPWCLVLLYLSFLVFFAWYVLEYQLPNYLQTGGSVPLAEGTLK